MKKLLLLPLLLVLLLSSCKKEEPVLATRMELQVMKQKKSSSGKVTVEPTTAMIHVWNAENKEFDVNASPDIQYGSAYDKLSESSHTMKYGAIGSSMKEGIKPGRYFVYVVLPKSSGNGSLAYSYSYFDVKKGETIKLAKTFSHDVGEGMYEDWDKNK